MRHPYTVEGCTVLLSLRVTPRAKRSEAGEVIALTDGRPALNVRVAAPPVEGAANKALITYLAASLKMPKSSVTLRSGETSRLKIVALEGDPVSIVARLNEAFDLGA